MTKELLDSIEFDLLCYLSDALGPGPTASEHFNNKTSVEDIMKQYGYMTSCIWAAWLKIQRFKETKCCSINRHKLLHCLNSTIKQMEKSNGKYVYQNQPNQRSRTSKH
jgi:hypothetical protein